MLFRLYPALKEAIFEDVCFEKEGRMVVMTLVHEKGFVELDAPDPPVFAKFGRHLLAEFGEVKCIENPTIARVEWDYFKVPEQEVNALQELVMKGGAEKLQAAGFSRVQTDVWIEAPLDRVEPCDSEKTEMA